MLSAKKTTPVSGRKDSLDLIRSARSATPARSTPGKIVSSTPSPADQIAPVNFADDVEVAQVEIGPTPKSARSSSTKSVLAHVEDVEASPSPVCLPFPIMRLNLAEACLSPKKIG